MNQTQTVIVYRNPLEAMFYQNIGPIAGGVLVFALLMWLSFVLRDKAARKWNWNIFSKKYRNVGTAGIWMSAIVGIAVLVWML